MQIIIDIPDEWKVRIEYNRRPNTIECGELVESIWKGKILPKGHGRLIDAWTLDKEVINHVHSGNAESSKDCAKFSMMIITAPTIIEADKE